VARSRPAEPRKRFALEPLEPRLLYSADLGPALLAAPLVSPVAEQRLLEPQPSSGPEIVFVDAATPDAERLIAGIRAQASGALEIVRLEASRDGLEQIGAALAGRSDVAALHIVSHGADGLLRLGSGEVTLQTLEQRAAQLEAWRAALGADADILLYGCEVAADARGEAFVEALARLTGADVAASTDKTGHAALGGDWTLEYGAGTIEARALNAQPQGEWRGVLASTPAGGEIQVNTTLGGNQTAASVAMDSNGNFVAVWVADGNLDGDGKGIFAQCFDASGNKLGGELAVNTTTAKDQTQASVAMDSNGNFVVVWVSQDQDPDGTDGIYGQRFNAAGLAQGGEFRVNSTVGDSQSDPSVAMDAGGNFTVVWTSHQSGNLDVFVRRYDAAGNALAAEAVVNTTAGGDQSDADVAMDSAGNFVVVWTAANNLDGNGKGVFAQRFDSAGTALGGEVRVNTTTVKDQTQASVAMTSGGDYVVAWTSVDQDGDRGGVFAQRFDSAGVAQGGEIQVNTQTHDAQDAPGVAVDGSGHFTVVWQSNNQDGSNKGIYAQSYDAGGFRLGGEFRVNSTTANAQSLPAIAMRGNGDFVVAWQGHSAADSSGIVAQRFQSINQAPANIVPGAQVAGGAPHVFSTALGNAIAVSDLDGGGAIERVTLTASNGTLTLAQTTGLTFLAGDGTSDAAMTFEGTLAALNAALDGMSFTATQNFSGAATLQIVSSDLGATGAGGALTDSDTVNITVTSEGTPFIVSGSYTGDALDNRAITGLGFTPDVVIVKVRDDNKVAVIRTSSMSGDASKEMTGGTALVANAVQSLDANGFTIGTLDTVNKAGRIYDWIAFKTTPGFLTVGTYTGDGVSGRTVGGLGLSPDALFVLDAGNQEAVFTNSAAGGLAFDFGSSANATWIPSLDADGFTLGSDDRVNGAGRIYHYVAWNELPGLMEVGSYAGDGTDNRNIAGVGFQPEWVVIKNTAGDGVVQHFDSQGAASDSSSFFTGNPASANRIQQLQADGFQVGADNDVNDAGRTYTYMAFRQETAPTISAVADQSTNEGTPTAAIAFTIGDGETAAGSLSLVATSSNPSIVADSGIVFGGSGAARTVTVTPSADAFGTVTITLRVSDGFAVASETFVLTVVPFNDAPTVSAPAAIGVNEDEASALIGIFFADSDAGAASIQAAFSVAQGTLSATSGAGVAVGGTSTNLTLTGACDDINAFIAAGLLHYLPELDDLASVTLGVSVNDLGNTGAGGAQASGTTNITLNVTAIDDAPLNAVPGAQSTATDTAIVFSTANGNAISVSDVDLAGGELELTLSVAHGTLTLSGTAGLTFSAGTGSGDATMTFSGTLADVNAALEGLRYDPSTAYSGPDALDVTSNDLGNSGSGGPRIVTNTVIINVNFVNSAPVLAGANDLDAIDEDAATDPGTPVSALVAGQVSDANALALSGIAVTAVDNSNGVWEYSLNGGSTWTAFGSPTEATARLLAADANTYVRFVPHADFNGTVANGLTFRAWDRTSDAAGATADATLNGGATAFSSATASASIVVNPVNDAPLGLPTVTGTATEDQLLTANTAGISDADGLGAFGYQWLRDGAAILGATASTYTLGDADVGGQISVQVSYTDAHGTAESVTSTQTAAVANVNDAPVGIPAITGTVTEDEVLTANTAGISDADGLGAFSYQWLRNGAFIAGATASAYTLRDVDVGAQMSVQVSYTDARGAAESVTSAQTAAVANVNDTPVGVPAITGTVTEDQVLTADTSGISDADGLGAFGYQWLRNGAAIVGATASTYTLADADVGAQISVQVSYTDAHGAAESVTSAQTAAVANVNDTPVGVPAITGTVTEDQVLTADTSGISDADGLGAFGYQWLRNGAAIVGATASTYTLSDADVGAQISVQVSYTDAHGAAESVTSAQTAAVANVNDAPAGVPAITGAVTEDQLLTADTSGISDADGLGAFGYQWLRNGAAIVGATASTYTLGDADVGAQISVQISYTDAHGTVESVTSAQTAAVANVNDAPIGAPTISGTATEDQVLTADTSAISDADGLGAFAHQWLRNGAAIVGATASTYTLGDADVGAQISVQVSFTDAHGAAESVTSAQTAAVANVNDAPLGAPTVSGTVTEDQTLTADTSAITDADGLGAFGYQWLRNGAAIGGATASTYTLGDAEVGAQISVQVSYTDARGTAESVTSAQTAAVANVNDAPAGVPTITGTVTEDQLLTADTSAITDADGLGAFGFQWLRNGAAIVGASASTYTLGDADVGAQISVQVSYTDAHGAAESATSAQTAAVANVNDAPAGAPAITGTVTEDQVLTADTSAITDADGLGALGYQWLRNGAAIGGATASTYTLGDADVGAQISVQVSYTDAHGTAESVTSAQTAAVANVNDAPAGVPAITGTATEDQLLTADTAGISDADGLALFGYQWLRNGAAIAGATATTYTLGDADVGAQISLQVSYTDGQGTPESVTSALTAAVANVNDAPLGAPAIAGTVTEDQVLTADTSAISDADGLGAFGYQWLRNGAAIGGATAGTYTLGDADAGAQISVQVVFIDGGGTTESLTSAVTAAVVNVNDAPSGADNAVTTLQDTAYVFALGDFGFADPGDSPANVLLGIQVLTVPALGTLTDNGTPVAAGQHVSAASIAAGLLRFAPAAGTAGTAYGSFSFTVQDDGGVANGGVDRDPTARTMTIDVAPGPAASASGDPAPAPAPAAPAPSAAPDIALAHPAAGIAQQIVVQLERAPGAASAAGPSSGETAGDPVAPIVSTPPIAALDAMPGAAQRAAAAGATALPGAMAVQAPLTLEAGPVDLSLFGVITASDGASSSSSASQGAAGLAGELDRARDELEERAKIEQWVTGSVAFGSFTVTVGYALWLLRGGALLASLLSSLPAWRLIDPLPVLARVDDEEEEDADGDEHAFASFVEEAPAPTAEPRA
jgi:hypothetical protein